jgi:ferredoxin
VSRYRHWLTHKLGTWHDQFGMSGCVGCGRCIAWCPTGIGITADYDTAPDIEALAVGIEKGVARLVKAGRSRRRKQARVRAAVTTP